MSRLSPGRRRITSRLLPLRGCDAFITGEPAERVNSAAKELGIHFYAAGHHATEKLGIQRLGDLLAENFGVIH